MIKNLKKAFTIIELVIVIAVIAILAAVMIPTYSSLVEKANQSADIQAVKQMNTILATYVDGSVSNISEAIVALDKDNIDLEDYKPLQKDHYFYFYMDGNTPKVVYTDAKDKAIYPEKANIDGVQLMSLSGDVPMDGNYTIGLDGSVNIDSGAKLVHLIDSKKDTSETLNITLSEDIDLKGSSVSFGEVKGNITIDGNNKTIKGLRADSNSTVGVWDGEAKDYGFALFNKVAKNENVTVKNLKISNVVVKDTSGADKAFGMSAVLFGQVEGTVNIENVTINNCDVYGGDKVGSVIGYLTGTAILTDVTINNTNIYGAGGVAKVVGVVNSAATLTLTNVNCSNVTTGINVNDWSKIWWSSDKSFITGESIDISEAKAYVEGSDNIYIPYARKYNYIGTDESLYTTNSEGKKIGKAFDFCDLSSIVTNDNYWINIGVVDGTTINGTIKAGNYVTSVTLTKSNGGSITAGARSSGNESYLPE